MVPITACPRNCQIQIHITGNKNGTVRSMTLSLSVIPHVHILNRPITHIDKQFISLE